ncbi:MAG TPA: hypothetical protein VNO31_52380 [Umezawaea sp.]|nr:hypothetical protein [Umezawaea sp.]
MGGHPVARPRPGSRRAESAAHRDGNPRHCAATASEGLAGAADGWGERVDVVRAAPTDLIPATALLLRPDGHVAWAASAEPDVDGRSPRGAGPLVRRGRPDDGRASRGLTGSPFSSPGHRSRRGPRPAARRG